MAVREPEIRRTTVAAPVLPQGIRPRMSDLRIYPSRLSDKDEVRLRPQYRLSESEQTRLVSAYNSKRGWAYSDAEIERMAKDYINGNDRTRAIIYARLEDANFHTNLSQIQQLADDPEAIAGIARRSRARRK